MAIKTTVLLREDLYAMLLQGFGRHGISKTVNEALEKFLRSGKRQRSLFGTMPKADLADVRQHRDRL